MFSTLNPMSDEDKAQLDSALILVQNLGLSGELCGSWLWVSGDTKAKRHELKANGFKYAPKKQLWFYRPSSQKSFSRGNWDMEKVRTIHGSQSI